MKKIIMISLGAVILTICFSANVFAQTAGTFTFSFTPLTKSPGYPGAGTQNMLAVWIQTSAGAFVKTKLRYAQVEKDHLPTYAVNSGGTASNCTAAACNKTDATTGATLPSFTAKTITWDGKNVNGTANGTLVADGVYKVTIEETWNHGTTGTVVKSYTFTKGPNPDHQTPANDANFTNIKLDWVPTITGPTVTTSVVNVKCKGNSTGTATATATGMAPYTYTWSTIPVQTTAIATGLSAGTYSITVKDANGTATAAVIITEPATALTSSVTTTKANCNSSNGSATVSASGGTGSYTYLWSNSKTTLSITGLLANTYSVIVTDANGCTSTAVANVLNTGAPTASVTPTNVTGCFGGTNGSATVTVSGGTGALTYAWNTTPVQTTTSITGLSAGNYTVTVTDASSCSVKVTATISQPSAINASLTSVNTSSCSANDGSIISNVSGGTAPYSYLWSNSKTTTTISGLATGNYSLTVTDVNGCKLISVATVSCTSGGSIDAGVNSVGNPSGNICGSTITPVVNLKNFGSANLTSCVIFYYVDSPPNQIFNWSGSLATGTSVNVTLPPITVSAGAHTFTSGSGNPNGSADGNISNDQSQNKFTITNVTTSIPLMEGFENGTSLPSGWSVENPDVDAAWEINSTIAHTGSNSISFNNCDGNGSGVSMTGTKDRFITSNYDFTNATNSASLSFDVAYAVLSYKGQMFTDSLAIFSSKDCGTTWSQIYLKGGTSLSGIITAQSCWLPTSNNDWRTDIVNLSNLAGQSNVMFAFENRSGWGEWIYLDNINITAITGITPINPLATFSIYPNPAATSFTIEGACNEAVIHYSIYNVVGAEITTGEIKTTGYNFNGKIQVSDIPRGMYFVKVSDSKNTWTKKLSVQ